MEFDEIANSKSMKIKLFAIAALGAFATACASTPPVDDTPPVQDTRPVERPDETPPPVETGPMAGSADDFVATAGDRVFYGLDRHDLSDEARATPRRPYATPRRPTLSRAGAAPCLAPPARPAARARPGGLMFNGD